MDGYQVESEHPELGGGSMFDHFATALRASDYQAVFAKQPDSKSSIDVVEDVIRRTNPES